MIEQRFYITKYRLDTLIARYRRSLEREPSQRVQRNAIFSAVDPFDLDNSMHSFHWSVVCAAGDQVA